MVYKRFKEMIYMMLIPGQSRKEKEYLEKIKKKNATQKRLPRVYAPKSN